jgi:hypothetical protein
MRLRITCIRTLFNPTVTRSLFTHDQHHAKKIVNGPLSLVGQYWGLWHADAALLTRVPTLSVSNAALMTRVPTLSVSNTALRAHMNALLQIPDAHIVFGGIFTVDYSADFSVPDAHRTFEPTAVFVPWEQILLHIELVTHAIFTPLQVVSTYETACQLYEVIEAIPPRLAAAVSNDIVFVQNILARRTNGTTYVGRNARTTCAFHNHFLCGGAIGSPESIAACLTSVEHALLRRFDFRKVKGTRVQSVCKA